MFNNTAIIEVVIGLVFVFSLMAILVTQINNLIMAVLNLRAKELKKGLQGLLSDPQLQAKMLGHPIIQMVRASVPSDAELTDQAAELITEEPATRLDYIPATTFVEALTGVLLADSEGGLYYQLQTAINTMPSSVEKSQLREQLSLLRESFSEDTLRQIYGIAMQVADAPQRDAVLSGIRAVEETLAQLGLKSNQLVPLLHGVSKINNTQLRGALTTLLSTAKNIEEAEQKLTAWFDDSMAHVTETFKRKLQICSIGVALLLSVLLNVDTLYLGRSLWEDKELRQRVAIAAAAYEQPTPATTATLPGAGGGTSIKDLERQAEETQQTVQSLLELQLPIGWQYADVTTQMIDTSREVGLADPRFNLRNIWSLLPGNNGSGKLIALWLQKLVGLLVTTIAAAQGAPFWFDIMNKLARRQ